MANSSLLHVFAKAADMLRYNPRKYDFRSHVASLLQWAGPKIGFGSYGSSEELELFQAKEVRQNHQNR